MYFRQRSIGVLFITWLSLSEGMPEARLSTGIRLRMSRCPRLDVEHGSDLSHEGQSHSLDAHFEHHQLLDNVTGAAHAAALVLANGVDHAQAVPTAAFRVAPPGIAFLSSPTACAVSFPSLPGKGGLRGRAPPSLPS